MVILPAFAPAYLATHRDERPAYVAAELRKLLAAGGPVLAPVLAVLDDELRDTAVGMLTTNTDDRGETLADARVWQLRLRKDAVPPSVDSQGRPLPPEKAGKALVVKLGNLGGSSVAERWRSTSDEWNGEMRALKGLAGENLHKVAEITAKARAFAITDAILILRKWGVGVPKRRYRLPEDRSAPRTSGQDLWLVEEVCESATTGDKTSDKTDAPKTKAA